MPGINLSPTGNMPVRQQEEAKNKRSRSVAVSVGILLIGVAAFAGARFGVSYYGKELKSLVADIEARKASEFAGTQVDRIARLSAKMEAINEGVGMTMLDPDTALVQIESSLLPDVVLSSYRNDMASGGSVVVAGTADSFHSVALQMKTFAEKGGFSSVVVDKLSITKEGSVEFSCKMVAAPRSSAEQT